MRRGRRTSVADPIEISPETSDYLLLAHIRRTSDGIGRTHYRPRRDPAAWCVAAALVVLSLLIVAVAGN